MDWTHIVTALIAATGSPIAVKIVEARIAARVKVVEGSALVQIERIKADTARHDADSTGNHNALRLYAARITELEARADARDAAAAIREKEWVERDRQSRQDHRECEERHDKLAIQVRSWEDQASALQATFAAMEEERNKFEHDLELVRRELAGLRSRHPSIPPNA
jgi:chromosome segregation ATPase